MKNIINKKSLQKLLLITSCLGVTIGQAQAEVTLESQVKITDVGLHFDGFKDRDNRFTGQTVQERKDDEQYYYHFGKSISAHGDAVKTYKHYAFMTWYRGGKDDRHMMLSRYNTLTGSVKTIEFPHQHTGYQGNWWVGESHNTIGLSVSPINGTIHMVFDMHAYSDTNHGGKFKDDFFRYSFSLAGAAEVPDEEFTLAQFVKDTSAVSQGDDDYKHLTMTGSLSDKGDFARLTYPKFFINTDGTLLLYMRLGGNNNGAYVFNRYDAASEKWSTFTPFNYNNQKARGNAYNWGLYGNMKYVNGKLRVGFQQRSSDNTDKYIYQNGIYYAYSDHPEGVGQWKNHKGEDMTWPLVNSDEIKIFEPGTLVEAESSPTNSAGTPPGSVYIVGSFDWTVTANGDEHFIHRVQDRENNVTVSAHTYKPAGATEFITTTDFAGASNIYTSGDDIYIIGLKNGRPFVEKGLGGTNDFERVYEETSGPVFDHGTVYVKDGKVYYYLMERTSGSAMPLHLQVIDLGLEADANAPVVEFPSASMTVTEGYEQLSFRVTATSPVASRTITKVDLYVDGNFIRTDSADPFVWGHNSRPTELLGLSVGMHTFSAIATDSEGDTTTATMSLEVASTGPTISFPQETITVNEGFEKLAITVAAEANVEGRTIESVTLYINDELVRVDDRASYLFGHNSAPHETGAMGWEDYHGVNPNPLSAGEHTFKAVALDSAGQTNTATMTLIVKSIAPTVSFPSETMTVDEGYEKLAITVNAEAATDDRTIESVTLYINDELVRVDDSYTYLFGHGSKPHETGAMGWTDAHTPNPNPFTAGVYTFKAVALDSEGIESEATMELSVVALDQPPTVSFPDAELTVVEGYEKLAITINTEAVTEGSEIKSVTLYRNGELVRVDTRPVWNFGHSYAPYEFGAMGWLDRHEPNPNPLTAGEHTFTAVAEDSNGLESTATMTLIVEAAPTPTLLGDLDADGDVDRDDVRAFSMASRLNQITDLAYDFNNDGSVNSSDVRGVALLCTRSGCATE